MTRTEFNAAVSAAVDSVDTAHRAAARARVPDSMLLSFIRALTDARLAKKYDGSDWGAPVATGC